MKHSFSSVGLNVGHSNLSMAVKKKKKKKLDGNYTRMLQAILNKFWRKHLTKQELYSHLPPITKAIQVR